MRKEHSRPTRSACGAALAITADVSVGMGILEDVITAVPESPQWDNSAFLLTYDEQGGYFDHVAPPQLDAFGLGVRVPMWVISPFAKKGPIATSLPCDFASTLKLLERLHGLPTLASQPPVRRRVADGLQLPGWRRPGAPATHARTSAISAESKAAAAVGRTPSD